MVKHKSRAANLAQNTHAKADLTVLHNEAIEKANQALENLKEEFFEWVLKDLGKLKCARDAVQQDPHNTQAIEDLKFGAHDLKGLGTTYGYPMLSRVAASLYEWAQGGQTSGPLYLDLIARHIDTMQAIVKNGITTGNDPQCVEIATSLEELVKANLPDQGE